ncbi:MAG: hypothetical protein H6Q35_1153 [Proteobacteria bacterium]|nr:hypothetical protein [Pseudomonadota bacterium]
MQSVKYLIVILFIAISFSGCAKKSINIDVSDSKYQVKEQVKIDIKKINIENLSNNGEMKNTILGSDSIIPIVPETPTKKTVEDDIKDYFLTMEMLKSSNRVLKIIVKEADSYWTFSDVQKIPIVGLFAVGEKVTYGLNLKILFEVEEDGKVIKSYTFNDTIKIKNGNATQDDIIAGYKKLISQYREVFFNEIHNQFTKRYL